MALAKIYYRWVRDGRKTIDEVPPKYRAAVQAMLDADKETET